MSRLIKGTLDPNTIAALLQGEQRKEDAKYVRTDLFNLHNFDKKMTYLFSLPFEHMFVPEKSTREISQGKWHCIACAAIGIKDRESHFNWHKRELEDK